MDGPVVVNRRALIANASGRSDRPTRSGDGGDPVRGKGDASGPAGAGVAVGRSRHDRGRHRQRVRRAADGRTPVGWRSGATTSPTGGGGRWVARRGPGARDLGHVISRADPCPTDPHDAFV